MPTTPTAPTAAPATPDRADRTTFSARATASFSWLGVSAVPQVYALAQNTFDNAGEAAYAANLAGNHKDNAALSAGTATTQAAAAAASAASAVNSPGSNATSTTSLTLGTGTKSLTIQTGKQFAPGQNLVVAYTTDPTQQMSGPVITHNNVTGALVINVPTGQFSGAGTYALWTVSQTSAVVATPTLVAAAGALASAAALPYALAVSVAMS